MDIHPSTVCKTVNDVLDNIVEKAGNWIHLYQQQLEKLMKQNYYSKRNLVYMHKSLYEIATI